MGWGCYFWVGARRGWMGARRGWGKRRGEARRSLKLTRGPRRGYKNVKKQPTGLSKEVRWALLEGGAGLVRGLIPALQRALHSPPQDFVEVCKREGGDPEKGVDRLLGLGSSRCGAGGGGSSGAPEIARVRLFGAWHRQLPRWKPVRVI